MKNLRLTAGFAALLALGVPALVAQSNEAVRKDAQSDAKQQHKADKAQAKADKAEHKALKSDKVKDAARKQDKANAEADKVPQ